MKVIDSVETFTYVKPNGEWGIRGVDLSTLPPKVYSALCKLKDIEHTQMALGNGRKFNSETQPLK